MERWRGGERRFAFLLGPAAYLDYVLITAQFPMGFVPVIDFGTVNIVISEEVSPIKIGHCSIVNGTYNTAS